LKKKWLLIGAIGLAAVILGICFWKSHILVAGRFYPRSSLTLDLREVPLEEGDYRRIREALPQCRILWQVPLSSGSVPSDARQITVTSLSREDLERMDLLTDLERVDAPDCREEALLLELRGRREDLTVSYRAAVGNRLIDSTAEALTVSGGELPLLGEKLAHFPKLAAVTVTQPLPPGRELASFQAEHPSIRLSWSVELDGRSIPGNTVELDLSGVPLSSREALENALSYLPELKQLDLHGCGLSQEDLRGVALSHPDMDVLFDITVSSVTVSTDARELDLSGIPMEDTREIEEALLCFTGLERVIMCDTGISNEEMDALGKRHPETRFVWTVSVMYRSIRTDAEYFSLYITTQRASPIAVGGFDNLKYCVDMVAIDLGHSQRLDSCQWAENMPKLKYLILADTSVTDLTPLSGLKELAYLEIFNSPVEDYSPLVGCTGLEDLNLGGTYGDPEPLTQMTWLKHLWWSGVKDRPRSPGYRALTLLPEALPDTEIHFEVLHPTAKGWRKLPNYFAMRDALGLPYMD